MAALVDPAATVVHVERLTGGLAADVHAVTVATPGGSTLDVVVRQLIPGGDAEAGGESERTAGLATTLGRLSPHPAIPSPAVLGVDPDGEHTEGRPALAMRRLPGAAVVDAAGLADGVDAMAALLAEVHHTDVDAEPADSWFAPERVAAPTDAARPELWGHALDLVLADPPPEGPRAFLHHDYQPFNLLWDSGNITGLVDWDHAGLGPEGIDVAHCRLNLAILASADTADAFLDRYRDHAGTDIDPRWDLQELVGYGDGWRRSIPVQVAGRTPLDVAGMTARVEELLGRVLARC
ncbi:MAG: phosphotransferase family protein [Acidimicrobiales bacterium]